MIQNKYIVEKEQMNNRILAIDVFRGLTIALMLIVNNPGSWSYIYPPLKHAAWHGCTPTDLVFPFFLFIVGVSMSISFKKYQHADRKQWFFKILQRTCIIFLIGLLLNWFPFYHKSFENLRLFGILQRIALAFGLAGLCLIFIRKKMQILLSSGIILLAYAACLTLFAINEPFSLEGNLPRQIDLLLLGKNHLYKGFGIPFDPEGLFSTLPGVAHVLLGYLAGLILTDKKQQLQKRIQILILWGTVGVFLGLILNPFIPINKPLWTSSYVLFTCGIAAVVLAALSWILDIKKWTKWSYPFKVFGLNPLFSFVLSILFVKIYIYFLKTANSNLYSWLYQNVFSHIGHAELGSLIQALCFTGFVWIFAWLLFRKNKVIKI